MELSCSMAVLKGSGMVRRLARESGAYSLTSMVALIRGLWTKRRHRTRLPKGRLRRTTSFSTLLSSGAIGMVAILKARLMALQCRQL